MSTLYNIFFSPTGSTKKAADQIATAFDQKKINVDLCAPLAKDLYIGSDDICVFAAPCFGGRIPEAAAKAFDRIHGDQTPAIVCIAFGNRAFDDALLELADLVTKNGFRVIAGCGACTEHSLLRQFGAGRPDADDMDEIAKFAAAVVEKLNSGNLTTPELPGNRPYVPLSRMAMPFSIDRDNCVNCGYCEQNCPVGAIITGSWLSDLTKCFGCMRCVKVCPMQCRSLGSTYASGLTFFLGGLCSGRKPNSFFL